MPRVGSSNAGSPATCWFRVILRGTEQALAKQTAPDGSTKEGNKMNTKFVEMGKSGCDGHHIFIDFATRVAKCVNRFTYGMRAQS